VHHGYYGPAELAEGLLELRPAGDVQVVDRLVQ
jgi:hypothetical protein